MFRINRLKYKNVQNGIIQIVSAKQSTASEAQRIVIPKKIARNPTDLLYTLSKTVGRDPTGPHYKFHDDPYLMPTSEFHRDQYALSKEAGKQTAQWIKSQHAELFNAKDAAPKVEAFFPKSIYTEESEVDVNCLQESVDSLNVADAILIYRLLTAKNVTIPDELKQNVLELVCFYNHNDPSPFDAFEERSHNERVKRSKDAKPIVWTDKCFADQLFESIEPKSAAAYNTIIRALYKYNNRNRAEELFNEANEKEILIDLATYNAHIRNISKPELTIDNRWELVQNILADMNKRQILPNVHTFNAVLAAIKSGGNIFIIQNFVGKILAELKALNIEPSLETYVHLLDVYHSKHSPESNVIYQIIDKLEKTPSLKAQSVHDLAFFYKSMVVCRFRLKNSAALARRIDNIVSHEDNVKFLGDSQYEQHYYRNFISTILHNEPFEDFVRTYDELVPETYSLEPLMAEDIFSTINITGSIEYIPKFWTDLVICGISKRSNINDTLLTLMATNQPISDVKEHEHLKSQFADIAWTIYQDSFSEQLNRERADKLVPAERLSKIVTLLLRDNRHENARTIIEMCIDQKKEKQIIGILTNDALSAFIDSCIESNEPRLATKCVLYFVENGGANSVEYGRKIITSFTLEPHEIKRITDYVGKDVLKEK